MPAEIGIIILIWSGLGLIISHLFGRLAQNADNDRDKKSVEDPKTNRRAGNTHEVRRH